MLPIVIKVVLKKCSNITHKQERLENATLITIRARPCLTALTRREKIAAAAKTLSLFGTMVHSSFGNLVEDDWVQDIHNFCSNYRALPGTTS